MKNTLFVLALLVANTCMATTKTTYDEIPKHLGPFGSVLEHRGFTVTTNDGKTHSGRRMGLNADHLRIFHRDNSYEDLPKLEVTRIEVRQAGRFFHKVVDNVGIALFFPVFAFLAPPSSIPLVFLTPLGLAFAGVTTPFFLAADGIAFLIPPKVYEIVH
jgi:hypothetical protein